MKKEIKTYNFVLSQNKQKKNNWLMMLFVVLTVVVLTSAVLLIKNKQDLFGNAVVVQKQLGKGNILSGVSPDEITVFAVNMQKYKLQFTPSKEGLYASVSKCTGDECKPTEICDDNVDNDEDEKTDCDDTDCFAFDSCLVTSDNKVMVKFIGSPSQPSVYPWGLTTTSGYDACKSKLNDYNCNNLELYSNGVWEGVSVPGCTANKDAFTISAISSAVRAVCTPVTEELFCEVALDSNSIPLASVGVPSDFVCYTPNSGDFACEQNKFKKCLYIEQMELGAPWVKSQIPCDYIIDDIQGALSYRAVCGDIESLCIDGIDNNLDGNTDCMDSDCVDSEPTCFETNCVDGIDNNNNNWIDCSDVSCEGKSGCAQSAGDKTGNFLFSLNSVKGNVGDIVEVPVYIQKTAELKDIRNIRFVVQFDSTKLNADVDGDGNPDVVPSFSWLKEGIDSDAINIPDYIDNKFDNQNSPCVIYTKADANSIPQFEVDLCSFPKEDLLVDYFPDGQPNIIEIKIDVPMGESGESLFSTYESFNELLKLKFKILPNTKDVVPIYFVETFNNNPLGQVLSYYNTYPFSTDVGLLHLADVGYTNKGAVIAVSNPEICDDDIDNDADTFVDCLDSDCNGKNSCEFGVETACDDTLDNDGDTLIDCDDTDCTCAAPITSLDVSNINLRGIDVLGEKIAVVEMSGKARQYTGTEWSTISLGSSTDLNDVAYDSSGKLFIATSGLKRVNLDGTIDSFTTISDLLSIYFVNDDLAYVVGDGGSILKYDATMKTDAGHGTTVQGGLVDISTQSYKTQNIPFNDVWVNAGGSKVFITSSGGKLLKYENGIYSDIIVEICEDVVDPDGQIKLTCHSNVKAPGHDSDFEFSAIWGTSEDNLYIAGSYSSNSDKVLIFHYDGNSWSISLEKQIAAYKTFNDVFGLSATDVYAVGSLGTIVHFDGTSWTDMVSGTTNNLYAVNGASAKGTVYIVGDKTLLKYSGGN